MEKNKQLLLLALTIMDILPSLHIEKISEKMCWTQQKMCVQGVRMNMLALIPFFGDGW